MLRMAHLFGWFTSLGGVQSLLKYHFTADVGSGFDSSTVIFFDKGSASSERLFSLGFQPFTTMGQIQARIESAFARIQPEVVIYHLPWALNFLSRLDNAARRILIIHTEWPDLESILRGCKGAVDGVLCVSDTALRTAHRSLPDFGPERIRFLPYPVFPPDVPEMAPPPVGRPLLLGYCGRLAREQKRIDRLPILVEAMQKAGLHFRFEIMGDGPDEAWLRRQLQGRDNVCFHGRQDGQNYWRLLSRWDFIVFTSDYEGTPISLLEAASVGVIPIYPRSDNGGAAYTRKIADDLLYEPDDLADAAQKVTSITRARDSEWNRLRQRCRASVAGHTGQEYMHAFSDFVRYLYSQPRISRTAAGYNNPLLHLVPLCALPYLNPLYRMIRRTLRGKHADISEKLKA
jgi:glycosyltransferase involved in cell wall biosynthesis